MGQLVFDEVGSEAQHFVQDGVTHGPPVASRPREDKSPGAGQGVKLPQDARRLSGQGTICGVLVLVTV